MAAQRIGHVANKGPSVVKEIVLGLGFGLMAGGLWKMHHWNSQRRTREFYSMLENGEISVVVEGSYLKLYVKMIASRNRCDFDYFAKRK